MYSFSDLVGIIKRLRAPDGCPWDKAQTPASIRACIIEEAFELVSAINEGDEAHIIEEAGDVILQGVFTAIMLGDTGCGGVDAAVDGLCRKLISRHTHIFGGDVARNAEEALGFWRAAKEKERGVSTVKKKKIDPDALLRKYNEWLLESET